VRKRNAFYKGHSLGNDYLVIDPRAADFSLNAATVRALCDRHFGIGADGVLVPRPSRRANFGLRIWNPDGSEAEKSGNGLRIFARYLQATKRTRRRRFTVETPGGVVAVEIHTNGSRNATEISVEMGRATFRPASLPCSIEVDELLERPIVVNGRMLHFTGVSVGNPHCVLLARRGRSWSREDLLALGPVLSTHPAFPRGVNVQLVKPAGRRRLRVLIWERGAGETLASGSSACAAAAAAVRLGRVESPVTVESPGGALEVAVGKDFALTLHGPVADVAEGELAPSFARSLRRAVFDRRLTSCAARPS